MHLGRTFARIILPLTMAGLIAAGCGGDNGVLGVGGIPDDAFCTVDGTAVKTKEFDLLVKSAEQQYKDNARDFPKKGTDELATLKSQAVEFLIQRELIRQQADRYNIKVTDKQVKKGVADLKKQYFKGDEKAFKAELKRTGYNEARVESDIRDQKLSEAVYKKVTKNVKVSDADAKKYYDEHPDQYVTKKSREVAHILVKDKKLADTIYAQVKGGDQAVFAKLAKQYSTDPGSKTTGGVLTGGVQQGQTVPEFDKQVFTASFKSGDTSQPIKTSFGYHVIQARSAIKPASKQKFEDVKADIKKTIQGTDETDRYTEWQKDVRKKAEDNVHCRKGYVWTQTVDTTKTTAKKDKTVKSDSKDSSKGDTKTTSTGK
ncbi:MAG: peptidylprolyl isomerase [Thermoleophilia bacterium]|nr:peptidylprolyl isomerase [Thermoleophilia bacterium]